MSDNTDLTSVPITVMTTAAGTLPANTDPLTQLASDIDARFNAGKAARLQEFGQVSDRATSLESRVTALETLLASIFDETPPSS